MSKLIRHVQKRGTALFMALQITGLILLSLLSFIGGPQRSANKAPAETEVSGPAETQTAQDQTQTDQAQTETAQAPAAADKNDLRASAIAATKLSGPRATAVFYLATSRAASASQSELPNEATLTTDQEDYQPYTYVYFTGTGFSPGETVNMIVVQLSPNPASYEPWDVVADANGNFETSWYVFSEELIGATMQATATGQTSNLTASATFTDAVPPKGVAPVSPPTGGFAIEGDLLSNTPTSPSPFAPNQGDWYPGPGGTGGTVLNGDATGTPVDSTSTFHLVDPFSSNTDDNFAGGDKVHDNPNTWNWVLNPVNNKLDMNNGLIHVAKDPITQHTWIMVAGDRLNNSGDAYIDFEFLQNTLTTTPLVGGTGGFSSAGPNCGRTVNDFLLTLKLTNGGTVADFFVSRWELASGNTSCNPATSYDYVDVTTPVITATPPAVFAAVNAAAVTLPPGNLTAFGNNSYVNPNTFAEAAVDLTALLGSFDPCLTVGIKTIFIKTKASQSTTANIVDFIVPQQLVPPLVIGPTVDAGPDQAKCKDPSGTTNFNLTGTAQPGTYPITSTTWSCVSNCGGVTISSPNTLSTAVTITGAGPVTATLRLTVTDSGPCANHIRSDDVNLTVNPLPSCSVTGPDGPLCPTSTGNTYTAPAGMSSYLWSISGNGSIIGSTSGQTVTVTAGSGCNASFTLTLTTTNANNCSSTCTKTVTVQDTTPPTIGGQGANATIECPATPSFTAPTASDACGGSTVQDLGATTTAGTCANNYASTKSWKAVDRCGNTSGTVSQTITVRDTTPPTIGGQGANATIECPATPSFTAPTASDTCSGATVSEVSDTTAAGTCANNYTRTKTWRAVDACGNTSTVSQTITVRDTTAPTIGAAGANATIECTATPSFTAPTASDACGTSTVVQDSDTTAAGTCAGSYSETRTWRAVDACGNTSASRNQTITVRDTTAPAIGSPGANNTVECPASPSFTAPTASDTCSGATVQNLGDTTSGNACALVTTRSWRAVDGCGNTSGTVTQTVTVQDTTAPTIGGQGSNATLECPATPTFTAPTASDTCSGTTVQNLGDTTSGNTCAQVTTRSWRAVDGCGNTSGTVSQAITVRDMTNPTIGLPGADNTVECPASPSFTAPTVSDTCSGATVENLGDTTSGNACALVTTRSWRAVDGCGNTSGTVTQSSTRVDTTNPEIGLPGADNTVECPASPSFTAPTVSDTCSGATVENLGDTTSGNACALVTTRSWRAVDGCGNTSGTVSQSSTRVDTTNPTIGSPGADNTVECPASPSFTAPSASDTCSGATVENLGDTTSGNACALVTTRSWRAVDGCGNTSGTVTQTSTRVDTTNPTIGSPGANNTVECPASPSFTAPSVSDTCSGATVEDLGDTTSGNACALVTTRSWRAVDGCGNTSGTVSQSSTRVDTTNPEIGAAGADNTVECPASPSFTAPSVSDTCSGATVENLGDTTSGNACALVTTRSWRAVDGCGNTSGTVTQTSTRVDTTNPTIGSPGANNTVECPASPSFTAPSVSDTCSGATVEDLGDTTSGNACALVTTRSWRAVDGCGNTSGTVTQSSTRVDTTNPEIGSPGADNTVECPASPSFTAPSVSDTCSGATVENLGDTTSGNACALVTTRSWRAVDGCGNTSGTVTQTSTRVDTTNPTIGSPGANNTVECPASPSFTAPTVSDTCSGATVENLGDTTSGNACALVTTRSWRAVDGCGNTSETVSQRSTRVDTTNPTIGSPGADNTVECPASPSFTAPSASDTCSGATVEDLGDTTSGNACALVTTRSWRAVDGCGNTSETVSQRSTRVDTTNPTIGSPGADNTVECPASPSFTAPSASDTCSGATVEDLGDTTSGNACALVTTRSWRAVDGCGNTSETVSQRSTRVDTTNPTIGSPGADNTVECPATPSFTAPSASDTCSGATVENLGDTTSGNACALVTTRSWRAVDGCGNTSGTVSQSSTRVDTTNPEIGAAGADNTVECPASPSFTAPSVSDTCSGATVENLGDTTSGNACALVTTRSWRAVDGCGNTSGTVTQTSTRVDTTNPTIGSPGANNTVECPASPSFTAPSVSDTCSGATVEDLGDTTSGNACALVTTRSWRAVDGCGNTSATVSQSSTRVDTTNPTIGSPGADNTVECPATPSFTAPSASDTCSGATVENLGDTTSGNACALVTTRSWRAVDGCGNTSETVSQRSTRVDTTNPTIGSPGADNTVECPASPSFTAPSASDTCSGATVENLGDTTSGNACALVTTRSWRAVDGCGNTSETVSQRSTRVDTTNPTIGSPGADNTVECPASPSFTAPSASDTCSGATVEDLGDTTSGNACALVTTRSWRAVDGCGNTSETVSQRSTRVDTTNPTIGSPGADNTVECPATPSFTAPSASDTCSGATVENLGDTTSGNACALVTTRSWRAVDGCGNTSGTVSQSSTRVDTTNPEIGAAGADNTVECPASPSFTAPTVSDTCSGATVEDLGDTTSGNACALVTTRSWRAVDGCGNTSETVSQRSTRVDTTNPTIGSPGADNTVECPASPSFTAPSASDTCSGATVEDLGDTTSGNACALVTTRSWRAVDGCGNTSETVSQRSTRVDTTNPTIGSPGADNTVECPASPSFTAPSASDTCSGATVENLGDTTSGNACALVTTRSWRAVDGCGNTSETVSQRSTRVDTTNPTIGSPGADNTVECPASPSFTAPSASDTCSGATVEDLGDTTSGNACALVTTRSWRAVDGCGNTSGTVSQSSTRVDTTDPEIGSPGANNTVECPASPSFTAPTLSDTCSGATVENLGDTTSGNACALVTTRSWRAVDGCGNTSGTVSQSSTRVDTTDPEIGSPGANNTVECPASPSFTAPTVSDTCSGATVENLGDTTSGNACALVTTRSWRAVDGCGNTSGTVSQSSTRVDTTDPEIGSPGANNTVECPASPSFTAPTVSDTCSGATVQNLGDTTSGNACALVTTRSWRAVDGCGNTSGTVSQSSTRVDTTNPEIGSPGANNTVECPASPSFTAPSASDTCSGATVENLGDTTSGNACALVTTRSWRAVDGCGNTSGTVSQSSTRVDTTDPEIGSPGANNTVECPASPSFTAPSASDTCSGATVENLGDTTSGNACALVTTRSWRAVDGCGNTSGTVSQSSTRVDTTDPEIGSPGANNTVECPASPSFTAPSASDTCSGATVENLGDTTSGNACALVTTRSWRAVDGCGNTSGTVSQSSTRVDTTDPEIGSPGANNTVECPASPSFTAPSASDTCSGATVENLGDTTSGNACALVTTRSWRAVDGCGNTSGTVSQSSTRVDTTDPEIGSPGANNTVECPASPSFTAPSVSDTCSGATVENLGDTTSGNACALVTTRSWRAVDGCGNTSGTVSQSSTRVDTTDPEIGSPGANNTVECPASPSFTAPTVSDTCSGATVENLGDTTSGNACALVTTRSWRAVDGCGNTSETVSQSTTRVDTTNPTIGSPGADNTVECPASPSFTAPSVSDTCSGATVENLGDTTSGNACALVTTRSWRAVDGCGNTSGTVSQRSTRVDTTNPTIGSPGADNTVECPASPSFTAPTVSDTCSGATVENLGDTTSGNACALVTTRSWRAVDGCGNTSGTVSQSSTRVDTTAPVIGAAGSNATIQCPATPSFTAPTASDACGGSTVNQVGDSTAAGTCANNYSETKTWRAVDACGNTSASRSQTITVVDTTAPTIGAAGANATIQCPGTPSFTAPTASDACGGSTVNQVGDSTAAGTCANNYSETKTWRAVDACGNTSASRSQTITVVDTTAPTIGAAGANATIQCPGTPSFTAPTASDACGGSTVNQVGDSTAAGTCANNYTRTKTWRAVDACGNTSASRSQTITVVDTTAPTIGSPGANTTIACNGTPVFTPPTASDACGTATVQQVSDSTTTQGTNTIYTRCWRAVDACSNTSTTVCQTITRPACTQVSKIAPTGTTCSQFRDGTADTLGFLNYSVAGGKVKNNVTPGVFFYWVSVTVPAGNNVITVTQTITTGNFTGKFDFASAQNVFNSNCNSVSSTITQNANTGTVTVSFNAPVAGTYIISIKYDSKSIVGLPAPSPGTTVHYNFATTGVPGSTNGLDLIKN